MTTYTSSLPAGHASMSGLLRSEWTKLRSLRSTWWVLGSAILVGILASAIATSVTRSHWTTMSAGSKATFNPISSSLLGVFFGGTLILGVVGILAVSAEYGTGTIRASLAAEPRRPKVLAAKVLVIGALTLAVGEVVALASFFLGQALLAAPATRDTLSSPAALRSVAGTGLYLCVITLFALGLAVAIRHTAGAIGAYAGVWIVLPIMLHAFPTSLENDIHRYLPFWIGSNLTDNIEPASFSPWIGLLVLCGYAVATLAIGTMLLVRRDA